MRQECLARAKITRVLQGDDVAAVDQNLRAQLQSLLRSIDDDDLIRIAVYGSRTRQIARDGLTQRRITLSILRIIEQVMLARPAVTQQ